LNTTNINTTIQLSGYQKAKAI